MNDKAEHAAAVRFPPPLLPILTIIAGHVLGRFVPILDAYDLSAPGRFWVGGLFCTVVVLVLVVWPFRQFERTGQDVTPWTPTPEIVVTGPYRFTRNPMYLAMVLFSIGFAIILSDVWILILTPFCAWLLYIVAIRHEEKYLEETFGDAYREYRKRVRRWI